MTIDEEDDILVSAYVINIDTAMGQDFIASLGFLAIGSRMRRLTDMMWRDVREIYEEYDIEFEPRWFPVFCLLSQNDAVTISEIARELGYTHPAVVQIANAMEKKQLVRSTQQDGDKRTRALTLTSHGRELLKKIQPAWDEIRAGVEEICVSASADLLSTLARMEEAVQEEPLTVRAARIRQQRRNQQVNVFAIERGNAAQADAFRKLNEEWLTKFFVIEPHDREMLNDAANFILARGGEIFLAEWSGEIIGCCAMIPANEGEYELAKMAVTERAQGRQIGKRLGEACVNWAKAKGARMIFLESNSRLTTALNLYRKLGFKFAERPFVSEYARSNVYMMIEL